MEVFRAEKVAELESAATKTCRNCNQQLELLRTIVDADSGHSMHLFECQCGNRIWEE